ncbi:conserved hypothetical protein [Tenacibaculum sp. 190524A02b]|uniref:Uncharacterized protein n=1 Tax=Tenacibaculum vairaonense TaxID=3137860 RepID=A0ABM9PR15_9FLAO
MNTILLPRNQGKTSKLIKESAKEGYYIICESRQSAHIIAEQARLMNLDIPFPICYEEFDRKQYCARNIRGFLLDNVDWYLQSKTTVPIKTITITSS